jgi:hypothetical protein
MIKPMKRFVGLLGAVLLPLAAAAQEFSADTVTHDSRSAETAHGKVYRGANMIRAEGLSGPQGMSGTFIIVDVAKQVGYLISPSRKMILVTHGKSAFLGLRIVLPVGETACTLAGEPPAANASCKKMNDETVNGRQAVKWEIHDTGRGRNISEYVWVDSRLNTIIKLQAQGTTIEVQNIQEGPQPASLFELPPGYQQMEAGGR